VRTKIEISPAIVRRVSDLDDLARVLFPDNQNHRRAFIAIWLEIKYADEQFLSSTIDLVQRYDVTPRTIEIVRAKLKKPGLIKRVSHFNPAHGYRSGWVFSDRCSSALARLSQAIRLARKPQETVRGKQKDRDAILYV